jgi:glycosidase
VGTVERADPGSTLDPDWVHGAFMQVFVRSYQDSDGDGIGDLRGLTRRLDYLKDLGVRGLWLLPVTRSQDGDHGYAVTHYRDIEPAYGSLADLDELLRQAHARGIGVVLDYVVNHSAALHPAFQNSRADGTNAYRNWYVWQPTAPAGWAVFGGDPWRNGGTGAYYAPFWDQMPDWNLRNPDVLAFHRNNLRFWLNRGVDGFRFDAVGVLFENGASAWEDQPESFAYLRDQVVPELAAYARRFVVCEAPTASAGFAAACGRAFAFGTQNLLLDAARGRNLDRLASAAASASLSPFLSNHDSFAGERPWHQLGADLAALKLAAGLALLREGTPFIYYGEEVGMGHGVGLSGDPRLRSPMSWTASNRGADGFSTAAPYRANAVNLADQNVAAQLADPASLLNHYKALLALRNAEPALARGSTVAPQATGSVFHYGRQAGNELVWVVFNTGLAATRVTVTGLPADTRWQTRFGSVADAQSNAQGAMTLDLPARSLQVLKRAP